MKTFPASPSGASSAYTGCIAQYAQNGICYVNQFLNPWGTPPDVLIAVKLESKSEKSKCAATETPYFIWSSYEGKTGLICKTTSSGDPAFGWPGWIDSPTNSIPNSITWRE